MDMNTQLPAYTHLFPYVTKISKKRRRELEIREQQKKGKKKEKKATNKDSDRVEGRETALKERRHCTGSALTRSHLSGNLLK